MGTASLNYALTRKPIPSPRISRRGRRVRLSRQSSLTMTVVGTPTANSIFWHWIVDETNEIIYGASGGDGIRVIDISTITSPSLVTTARNKDTDTTTTVGDPIRGVIKVGNTLFACSRTGSNGTGTGRLVAYDVTTPASIACVGSVEVAGDLYSDIAHLNTGATDYICVSGQLSGFWIYNVSNPAAMSLTGQLETGFETQGLDVQGDYAYVANYDGDNSAEADYIRVIDCSTPASPTIVGTCKASTAVAGVALRPWDCIADGNYLYVVGNTSGGVGDSNRRGLLTVDITTPASVTDWLGHEAIGTQDNDTWNNVGDRPHLGLAKKGDFVYVANGQKGISVFDVKTPAAPIYLGLHGNNMASGTNLWAVEAFTIGGSDYLVYGSGGQTFSDNNRYMYIDKIIYE